MPKAVDKLYDLVGRKYIRKPTLRKIFEAYKATNKKKHNNQNSYDRDLAYQLDLRGVRQSLINDLIPSIRKRQAQKISRENNKVPSHEVAARPAFVSMEEQARVKRNRRALRRKIKI